MTACTIEPMQCKHCRCNNFNQYVICHMSKTFIGCAVCREFESEAPAAEEMLDHISSSRYYSTHIVCSCRCALKVMEAELLVAEDRDNHCNNDNKSHFHLFWQYMSKSG